LWHWQLQEVSNWKLKTPSRSSCLDFHSRETGKINFSQLPEASSVLAWRFLQFSMHDWKHCSSSAQWSFFSSMEHQTLGKNLKSMEVSNLCHILGLLFYDWRTDGLLKSKGMGLAERFQR
jgi:hypothetical protein